MTKPIVYTVTARNTARSSPNKMHDDDVARSYGFAGGLVPGVAIFAWMCRAPMDAYGSDWIERGTIEARFVRPVYADDEVAVEALPEGERLALTVRARGEVCAGGSATPVSKGPSCDVGAFRRRPLPDPPPQPSPETLVLGRDFGTVDVPFDADRAGEYLSSIAAHHALPDTAGVAHPGWLILLANLALSNNVALGPWIHVSSDMRFLSSVRAGERVSALSRVADCFERKGNRFVDLDVVLVAGEADRPVASVVHRAIYEPRRSKV